MRILRLWINLLLMVVPLLWLGFGASRLVRGVWGYLSVHPRLAQIVSAEASRILEREVQVNDVRLIGNFFSLSAPLQVEARGIRVADGKTFDDGLFARANRLWIPFSWRQLLFNSDPKAPYLSEIEVGAPTVFLARDREGRWNYESLIKPKEEEGRRFANKISVTDGILSYTDQAFPYPPGIARRSFSTRVTQLTGVVLLRIDSSTAFDVTGKLDSKYADAVHLTGVLGTEPSGITLRVVANKLQLSNLGASFLAPKWGRVSQGMADVDVSLLFPPSPKSAKTADDTKKTLAIDLSNMDYSGTLRLVNTTYRSPEWQAPLENVHGAVSFVKTAVQAELTAQVAGTSVQVSGKVWNLTTPKEAVFETRGSVLNADIQRLVRTFDVERRLSKATPAVRRQVRATNGQADVRFTAKGIWNDPSVSLTAFFPRLQSGKYRAESVDLRGQYANKTLHADVRGVYGKGAIAARGEYAFDTGKYHAEARGRGLELAALGLPTNVQIAGKGRIDLAVQGERERTPRIQGHAHLENVAFRGQSLSDIHAQVDTIGKELIVRSLRVEDARGFALAKGTINLETHALNLIFGADELDIGALVEPLQTRPAVVQRLLPDDVNPADLNVRLPQDMEPKRPANLDIEGVAYLRGRVTGTWDAPRAQARLSGFAVQLGKFGLDQVEADVSLTKDALIVSQGTAQRYPGRIRFSGLAAEPFEKTPSLSLTVSADDLDVRDLLRIAGVEREDLRVSGTLTSEDILIEGTLDALRVRRPFRVTLSNGVVNGLPIEQAFVEATYDPNGLQIIQSSATVAGGTLLASGQVGSDGKLDLRLSGEDLNVESLAVALPGEIAELNGQVAFQGTVNGTLEQPSAQVVVSAENLDYNGFKVGTLQGTVGYEGRRLALRDTRLTGAIIPNQLPGTITISRFDFDPEDQSIAGRLRWDNLHIQRLRELFLATSYATTESGKKIKETLDAFTDPLEGAVSGTLALAGTREDPKATLTLDARNLRAGTYAINTVTGSALVTKEGITIPAPTLPQRWIRLELPEGIIEAKDIEAVYGGNVKADISAYNVDLVLLKNWVKADWANDITGQGDLFIVAEGKTEAPELTVSVNLRDLGYQGRIINSIEVDRATVKEGSIQADTIRLSATEPSSGQKFTAQASGSVGFSYMPPFIAPDAPLNFEANLRDQDIQTLSGLFGGTMRESEGKFSAGVEVTGTREKPQLTGLVSVQAPKIKLRGFSTGLSDVSGALALQGDRLSIQPGFTATPQIYLDGKPVPKKTGSPLILTGNLPLGLEEGTAPQTGEIRLSTEKLFFGEAPFPGGTTGGVSGTAALDLRVTGSVKKPTLSGEIVVSDANAALPAEFVSGPGGGQPAIDPRFDLTLRLAQNVRLKNSQLDARTDGEVRLTGSLTDPTLFGRLSLNEGRLTLPTARFTIQPPGSLTLVYPTYEAAIGGVPSPSLGINVDLKAQTSLTAASISGVSRNYRITVTAKGPLAGNATDPITGRPRLALNFQSDPPDLAGSQEALQRRLVGIWVGSDAINQIGVNPAQAIATQITNVFTSSVLPGLFDRSAQNLGFEQLSLNYDPLQQLSLSVSRHLFGPLYLSYTRSLTAQQEMFTFRLSGRFKDHFQASWEVNERNEQRVLLEGIWRF